MSKSPRGGAEAAEIMTDWVYPEALLTRAHELATAEAKRSYLDLARAVAAMSETYTSKREALADLRNATERYVGTLAFFFARDLPKAIAVFDELAARSLLPRGAALRVLDLGAGLGTTSLGLARFAKVRQWCESLRIDAVEVDGGALDRMRKLAEASPDLVPTTITSHPTRMETFLDEARGPYDVVLLGLSLNELASGVAEKEAMVARLVRLLAPAGVVVIVEPALHDVARELMTLRDALAKRDDVGILGPCTHEAPCPMLAAGPRDWCHAELRIALPAREGAIAERAGLRDVKPTFAWLALGAARPARGAEVRLVSRPMATKGKTEIVACATPGLIRVRAIDRDEVEPPLGSYRRGELARLEGYDEASLTARLGRGSTLSKL